jgi:hypothetical protein
MSGARRARCLRHRRDASGARAHAPNDVPFVGSQQHLDLGEGDGTF